MTLPIWAKTALETYRPKPPYGSNTLQPDDSAVQRWTAYRDRFERRWSELESDLWSVRATHSNDHTEILTAALECARRLAGGVGDPRKVIEKRRKLLTVDRKISKLAQQLAELFEEREELESELGATAWRAEGADAIDLWQAIEIAFEPRPGGSYDPAGAMAPMGEDLMRAVHQVQDTSLRVPEWADVLQLLAERYECGTLAGEFPDITSQVGNTNRTKFSPWCGALIRMLHGRNVLSCLSDQQLANLASVALESDYSGAINAKQIAALRRSEVARQA
jgi:hypothetical protein